MCSQQGHNLSLALLRNPYQSFLVVMYRYVWCVPVGEKDNDNIRVWITMICLAFQWSNKPLTRKEAAMNVWRMRCRINDLSLCYHVIIRNGNESVFDPQAVDKRRKLGKIFSILSHHLTTRPSVSSQKEWVVHSSFRIMIHDNRILSATKSASSKCDYSFLPSSQSKWNTFDSIWMFVCGLIRFCYRIYFRLPSFHYR